MANVFLVCSCIYFLLFSIAFSTWFLDTQKKKKNPYTNSNIVKKKFKIQNSNWKMNKFLFLCMVVIYLSIFVATTPRDFLFLFHQNQLEKRKPFGNLISETTKKEKKRNLINFFSLSGLVRKRHGLKMNENEIDSSQRTKKKRMFVSATKNKWRNFSVKLKKFR